MKQVFADLPEAIKNTIAGAERCNLQLQFGQFHLPNSQVPEGYTLETYLAHLSWEGLKRRYPAANADVEARLKYELDVIQRTGFAGYFLVVLDLITLAKGSGHTVGLSAT